MSNKIACTNEIVGAMFLDGLDNKTMAELRKDPHSFLKSQLNADLPDSTSVNFVDNSSGVINLTLPYYAAQDGMTAENVATDDMDNVHGGEIVGIIIALISVTVAAGVAGVGVAVAEVAQNNRGYNLDGSPITDPNDHTAADRRAKTSKSK